ncbi:MAG: hypothetical protein WBC93_00310 [Sulfitobacter sp.]
MTHNPQSTETRRAFLLIRFMAAAAAQVAALVRFAYLRFLFHAHGGHDIHPASGGNLDAASQRKCRSDGSGSESRNF